MAAAPHTDTRNRHGIAPLHFDRCGGRSCSTPFPATSCWASRWASASPTPSSTLYDRIQANPARRRASSPRAVAGAAGGPQRWSAIPGAAGRARVPDYPDLDYVKDLRAGHLPPTSRCASSSRRPATTWATRPAQRGYISTNYTFVARDMALQGHERDRPGGRRGAGRRRAAAPVAVQQPDVTLEVVERFVNAGPPAGGGRDQPADAVHAQWRRDGPEFFDLVVTDLPARTLFGRPTTRWARPTTPSACTLSLVVDGGTLQIGIGSLGDAIAQALIVRDRHGAEYRQILQSLCGPDLSGRETGRFDQGLYGCCEMFVNGFPRLIESRHRAPREVFADATLQTLINDGRIGTAVTPTRCWRCWTPGASTARWPPTTCPSCFATASCAPASRWGPPEVGDTVCGNDLRDDVTLDTIAAHLIRCAPDRRRVHDRWLLPSARRFLRAPAHHAGAGAGEDRHDAHRLHQPALRPPFPARHELKCAQRHKARFMNTTMMVTLLGAACERRAGKRPGRQRRGWGSTTSSPCRTHARCAAGDDAARHPRQPGRPEEQHRLELRPRDHSAPPARHRGHRYGVADLRGRSTPTWSATHPGGRLALPGPAHPRGPGHGKLEANWRARRALAPNLPEKRWRPSCSPGRRPACCPTSVRHRPPTRLHIVRALKRLKRQPAPAELVTMVLKSLWEPREAPPTWSGWAWTTHTASRPVHATVVCRQPVAARTSRPYRQGLDGLLRRHGESDIRFHAVTQGAPHATSSPPTHPPFAQWLTLDFRCRHRGAGRDRPMADDRLARRGVGPR